MTAQTYYTYRIHIANQDNVQVDKLQPQGHSLGQPSGPFGYRGKRKQQIDLLVQAAQNEQLTAVQVKELGETLFDALFEAGLRADFVAFYQQVVQQEKQLLRVELDVDEKALPEVAALPWEFMRLPSSAGLGTLWLGTEPNLVFSRRRAQWFAAPPIQLAANEKLRIALAVAAPADPELGPVEYQAIWDALEKLASQRAAQIELLPLVNPASAETIDGILRQEPHIFHFIGHGRSQNAAGHEVEELALTDEWQAAIWTDADYFSELFNEHRPGVVLLQACEGGKLSSARPFVGVASRVVQQNIPVVVAMQYKVSNATATRFAHRFYQQLLEGQPVDRAAQNGRRSITLDPAQQYKSRDFATPVLFMRVADGHLFQRAEAATPATRPEPAVPVDAAAVNLPNLVKKIDAHFSLAEMNDLIFDLGEEPENIPGGIKSGKARELVTYFDRRGRLAELLALCRQLRPQVSWP